MDVKCNIYEMNKHFISMDVVSDYYQVEHTYERADFIYPILLKDKHFSKVALSICPVDYKMFGTRKELGEYESI